MKKIFSLMVFSLSLLACSQNQTKNTNDMHEINSSNYVEKILENVKHYAQEPTYWLRISIKGGLEIYLNDMPVFKYYNKKATYASPVPINYMILKSGVQKFRITIFSDKKEAFTNVRVVEKLKNKDGSYESDKLIKTYEETIKMPSTGIYEGSFTFEARVPYENKGWIDGQDLTQFDKKELEKAVVAFYTKMWNIYNDKTKKEELFPLIFNRDREIAISEYSKKEDVTDVFKELMFPYTNKTYEMQPLENYKMVYYGDGRVVALEQTSMDIRLRGESSFWAKLQSEKGTNMMYTTRISLYLPKGKTLKDGLEIIR